jgi:hypothetical protein
LIILGGLGGTVAYALALLSLPMGRRSVFDVVKQFKIFAIARKVKAT